MGTNFRYQSYSFILKDKTCVEKIKNEVKKFLIYKDEGDGPNIQLIEPAFENVENEIKCSFNLEVRDPNLDIIHISDLEKEVGFQLDLNNVEQSCEDNNYDYNDLEDAIFEIGFDSFDILLDFGIYRKKPDDLLNFFNKDITNYCKHTVDGSYSKEKIIKTYWSKSDRDNGKKKINILNLHFEQLFKDTDYDTFFSKEISLENKYVIESLNNKNVMEDIGYDFEEIRDALDKKFPEEILFNSNTKKADFIRYILDANISCDGTGYEDLNYNYNIPLKREILYDPKNKKIVSEKKFDAEYLKNERRKIFN